MAETGVWMPMYWGDYLADTMHLSTFQHGCYLLLIAAYWRRGGPLPDDMEYLSRVCRTSCDKLARYGNPILAMFTRKDGLLIHKRIENEILRSSKRLASARASGKAGGLAKSYLSTTTTTKKRYTTANTESSAAREAEAEPARAVGVGSPGDTAGLIEELDRALLEHYGESRPWPHPKDATWAGRWIGSGIPPPLIVETIHQLVGRKAATDPAPDPPTTLGYFDRAVRAAHNLSLMDIPPALRRNGKARGEPERSPVMRAIDEFQAELAEKREAGR
jgi:uncharacterized protein YdaU (DUF1376 family)